MEFKLGQILIAKDDFYMKESNGDYSKDLFLIKDKEYEIVEINDDSIFINSEYHKGHSISNDIGKKYNYAEYFYSPVELRKIKLEKINAQKMLK